VPRTEAGAHLTEAQRQAQVQVRARALRDYLALWPLWAAGEEDETGSLDALALASVALIWTYHRFSRSLAASYFTSFRAAERVRGSASPIIAPEVPREAIVGTLNLVGQQMYRDARRVGQDPRRAREAALVRTSGTVTRLVLAGGRETIIESARADPEALGWLRVTDSDPCPFCRLLAGRGPVYKKDTVGFCAHDHCTCAAEVYYPCAEWPGLGKQFRDEYNQAVREARAAGELRRGTENDSLNALRRFLSKRSSDG
jgi:hypothetical protein